MFPKRNVKYIYILAFAAILKSFQSLAAKEEQSQMISCERLRVQRGRSLSVIVGKAKHPECG